jgi:outer membrane protein OmpA-like peptidoglycan-associated protein
MMNMSRKWMILLLLILGAMIASGCASKDRLMAFDEAKAAFQKATAAGAKKCAPCDYAAAEANLALADHGIDKWWFESNAKIDRAIEIAKNKSLEALKATPCEKPAPPPEPPKPAPPPPPPPEPPKPAPAPPPPPKPAPVFENVYFNENKTNIDPVAAKALDRDAMILKDNPGIKVEIGGHTDAVGSEVAKQKISEKRAESAKKYLMDKFNIPGDRMIIKGFGSQKPIADNKSKEGRAKNRRVEFRVIP